MALRDQFVPDLESVFYNTDEHATLRRFRITDGKGGFQVFDAPCVWDEEASKERTIVKAYNIYVGDVQVHILAANFPRRPLAGEIIYSPPNQGWTIVDCTLEEGAYVLALEAYRGH
jgi:hypothetical protein